MPECRICGEMHIHTVNGMCFQCKKNARFTPDPSMRPPPPPSPPPIRVIREDGKVTAETKAESDRVTAEVWRELCSICGEKACGHLSTEWGMRHNKNKHRFSEDPYNFVKDPADRYGGLKMADGNGCTCHAKWIGECACGADWTPQELIDARATIKHLTDRLAHISDRIDVIEENYRKLYKSAESEHGELVTLRRYSDENHDDPL